MCRRNGSGTFPTCRVVINRSSRACSNGPLRFVYPGLPESEVSCDNKYNHNQTDQIDHPVHATPPMCQTRRVPPAIDHAHVEGLSLRQGLKESLRISFNGDF